ncbi:MAG: SDR family NAD(P)-dependent oxidoreductase [Blastocatellia bacterium]|nr:SDR family NAD(P)-dependent oxidoreductase [Blastocatellia bacterium]
MAARHQVAEKDVNKKQKSKIFDKYGSWAVVTGASDGIGREIAIRLGEAGFNLVLVARRQKLLEEVGQILAKKYNIMIEIIAVDLSEMSGIQAVVKRTQDIDVGLLVASAGFGASGYLVDTKIEEQLIMVDVNCRAVVALSYHFSRRFVERKRGGIILMSSLFAFQGVPKAAGYAATKAFVQTFAEGLRLEVLPFGVDVVASAPGPIHSGFAKRADMQMGMGQMPKDIAQEMLNALGYYTTVRPGWLSKFLEASLFPLPRWARSRILGIVMKGMTRHHERRKSY